jgi:thiamine biosynthesis lipoprotein
MHRFRHEAMATRFEFLVADVPRDVATGAAQEAFADIDRLETELSRFRPDSDISRLRSLRAGQSATVGLAALDCLALAKDVYAATGGAFDVAIAPLWEVWRGPGGHPRRPSPDEIEAAAAASGSHLFEIDLDALTVTSHAPSGLQLDLGGIGKGYALDQAAEVFRRWRIGAALLNAGDSTVLALAPPSNAPGWVVGSGLPGSAPRHLAHRALSGSGPSVKGAHIIDPRARRPVEHLPGDGDHGHAWASAPTAALADALSTAFAVMRPDEIEAFCRDHPEVEAG